MEMNGQAYIQAALFPENGPMVAIEYHARWVLRTVCTFWRAEKSLIPARN